MWRAAEASTYVKAPRSLVYSVLRSYDLYRTWAPDIVESRLFAREGDMAVAELVCPPYTKEKFLLELIETPESAISFRRIDRDRLELSGGWRLEEADKGASVVVRADLKLESGFYRIFAGGAMRSLLARTLQALKERCLKVAAARERGSAADGELILDLVRDGDGLVVRISDHVYELGGRADNRERE